MIRFLREIVLRALEVFKVLDKHVRLYLVLREILSYAFLVTELLSIISVIPFLGMVANPGLFEEKAWMQKIADFLGTETTAELTVYLGLISLSALIVRHVIRYYLNILSIHVSIFLGRAAFRPVVRYYLNTDYEFHLRNHSGVLMQNLFSKIPQATFGLISGLFGLSRTIVFFVMGTTILLIQDPILAMIGLGGVFTVLAVYTLTTNKKVTAWQKEILSKRDELRKNIQDSLHAVEDVKMQGREREYEENMTAMHVSISEIDGRLKRIPALLNPLLEIVLYGTVVLTIVFYAAMGEAQISITSLALFGLVSYRMLPPLRGFHDSYMNLKNHAITYDLVRDELLGSYRFKRPPTVAKPITDWRQLQIKNVSYGYSDSAAKALDSVSLDIDRGASVGICGLSGSGKSTLLKVMLGLLRHQSGSLSLDGKEMKGSYVRRWQNSVSYVPQNIATLNTTLFNNIAVSLGSAHVDKELAQRAIEAACLGEHVATLDGGLNSIVGQDGKTMSAGQKQRLAIARAFYRQADCLVLDEGTSALDGVTEQAVIKNIQTHLNNATLIMVAHRINTIRNCDVIYVMRAGQIDDIGTYEELFARNEYFRGLTGLITNPDIDQEEEDSQAPIVV